MAEIVLITETELRECVQLDRQSIDIVEQAFASLAGNEVIMPPVLSMELPQVNGEVDVKTAFIPGLDSFTIKISPGFFDNPLKGLPSLNGLMVTFAANTGLVRAVLLDNGYLTDIRTAAAGGVAARHLAPDQIELAGIVGAGVQARLQAQALLLEREVEALHIWARDPAKTEALAGDLSTEFGIPVSANPDLENMVRSAQVVITTTPAREPLILAEWLHPGLHITAMGSDSPEKNELDPAILRRADRLVVDRVSQSLERGEMRSAVASGVLSENDQVDEIGQLCTGERGGRQSPQQITVCDLTGTGVQDTAIADHVLGIINNRKFGTRIQS